MRVSAAVLVGFTLLACACAHVPRVLPEDLSTLMGSPEETGLLLIQCRMMEKDDKLLDFDTVEPISFDGCSIMAKGGESQPIQAKRLAAPRSPAEVPWCLVFPNLEPGVYCIHSISGGLARAIPATESWEAPTVETGNYTYRIAPWSIRDLMIEVAAGVPTYFGEIVITESYHEGVQDRQITITRMGASEPTGDRRVVEVAYSPEKEKKAWKALLDKYPTCSWSEAMRARLEELPAK
jgi:hypothetical protein